MKKVQGIVERALAKELDKPRDFTYKGKTITNTHRYAIKLEGDERWFSLGEGENPTLGFKDDDGEWQPLGPGSEVVIKYEENQSASGTTYYNSKRSLVTVIDLVPGEDNPKSKAPPAKQSASAPSARASSANSGTDWARKDAGAAASASVDKAIAYLSVSEGFTSTNADYTLILDTARAMQDVVCTLADEILSGKSPNAETKPKRTRKATPQPEPSDPDEVMDEGDNDEGWED